ncbi:MAG: hypothetical protein ABI835_05015 [Chloroflexota bacterium]
MSSQPGFACDMLALTAEQRQQHQQVAQRLTDLRLAIHELKDGYAFEYAAEPETYVLLGEFMSLEHLCCPFFRLALEVEPEAKSVWLRVTGAEGVKAFVQAEFLS